MAAEKIAYSEDIVYAGPIYKTSTIDDNKIIISFNETGSGLTTNDGEAPAEFAIAAMTKNSFGQMQKLKVIK